METTAGEMVGVEATAGEVAQMVDGAARAEKAATRVHPAATRVDSNQNTSHRTLGTQRNSHSDRAGNERGIAGLQRKQTASALNRLMQESIRRRSPR